MKKRTSAEQIVTKLRQMEVLLGQGKHINEACREIGITNPTYYKWKKQYGKATINEIKRLKALEKENERLKKLVAELSLDIAILKDVQSKNF